MLSWQQSNSERKATFNQRFIDVFMTLVGRSCPTLFELHASYIPVIYSEIYGITYGLNYGLNIKEKKMMDIFYIVALAFIGVGLGIAAFILNEVVIELREMKQMLEER